MAARSRNSELKANNGHRAIAGARNRSSEPPGAPGGFSFGCVGLRRGARGWTPRPAFAKRTSLGGVPADGNPGA